MQPATARFWAAWALVPLSAHCLLKRLRKTVAANTISIWATLLFAAATLALALAPNGWLAGAVMFAAGLAWIGMLTSLNVAAQMASPGWVKARALAVYLLVFQGAMTGGSILWGTLASRSSVTGALTIAAAGLTLTILLALRWRLPKDAATDLAPSNHWAEPVVAIPLAGDRGPVLIEIEYRIAPERQAEFTAALRRFRSVRQRDGAIRWDVWEDVAQPGRVVEGIRRRELDRASAPARACHPRRCAGSGTAQCVPYRRPTAHRPPPAPRPLPYPTREDQLEQPSNVLAASPSGNLSATTDTNVF